MSKHRSKLFFTLAMLCLAYVSIAQPKYNSPYSRFGMGDLFDQNFVNQSGMGGLSTAYNDAAHLNILNPASLPHLRTTAFELAANTRYSALENKDGTKATLWGGNLSYLALGFPMQNSINEVLDQRKKKVKWGMSLALVPFTTVGYDIKTTSFLPGADTIRYAYEGTGGTYRFVWGNGIKIKNFSAGINVAYLFGKISRERRVSPDLENVYDQTFIDDFSVGGFLWDVGFQYDLELDKDRPEDEISSKKITFGLTASANNKFRTNSSFLYRSFNASYNDLDTVAAATEVIGEGLLPGFISVSAMYVKRNKVKLGVQFDSRQWSAYSNDAKSDTLNNTIRIAVGGEYIPDFSSYNNYAAKIRYRLGAFYGTDPRSVFNNSLTNYGINIGFGLPVILPRQRTSFVNVAFELGKFGTPESLQETYGKLSLGFTLNDNSWFFKRKFN